MVLVLPSCTPPHICHKQTEKNPHMGPQFGSSCFQPSVLHFDRPNRKYSCNLPISPSDTLPSHLCATYRRSRSRSRSRSRRSGRRSGLALLIQCLEYQNTFIGFNVYPIFAGAGWGSLTNWHWLTHHCHIIYVGRLVRCGCCLEAFHLEVLHAGIDNVSLEGLWCS